MALSPEDAERLKRVAKAALVPVIGYAAVKYYKSDERRVHAYYLEHVKGFIIGFLKDDNSEVRFTGDVVAGNSDNGQLPSEGLEVELGDDELTEDEIAVFERADYSQDPESPETPLQTG